MSDLLDLKQLKLSDDQLEAGAAVLREQEPDWFMGWPRTAHYGLVNDIAEALCSASCKADRAPSCTPQER